jgi:hypothetical protein
MLVRSTFLNEERGQQHAKQLDGNDVRSFIQHAQS